MPVRYPYHDADGNLVYTVERREGKRFHITDAHGVNDAVKVQRVAR